MYETTPLSEKTAAFCVAMKTLANALRQDGMPIIACRVDILAARMSRPIVSRNTDMVLRIADEALVLVEPFVACQFDGDNEYAQWTVLLDEALVDGHVYNQYGQYGARIVPSRAALRATLAMAQQAFPKEGADLIDADK